MQSCCVVLRLPMAEKRRGRDRGVGAGPALHRRGRLGRLRRRQRSGSGACPRPGERPRAAGHLRAVPGPRAAGRLGRACGRCPSAASRRRSTRSRGRSAFTSRTCLGKAWSCSPPSPNRVGSPMRSSTSSQHCSLDVPAGRKPDGFYRRVAAVYAELALLSRRPATDMAEASGVSAAGSHRWVAEARRRGICPGPSRKARLTPSIQRRSL